MNQHIPDDTLRRTADACAWLFDLAEYAVQHCGCDPAITDFLQRVGSAAHEAAGLPKGGMGAVAPMATQSRH
jgi:hypothetical protein